MSGNRHGLRDALGRFAARPRKAGAAGLELKQGRGGHVHGRARIRLKHGKALTQVEIATFLATLAETCNVSHSARAAIRQRQVFYALRRRDPDFRAAWMEALREGYDHLALRVRKGTATFSRKSSCPLFPHSRFGRRGR
jgi:hypothetical protein